MRIFGSTVGGVRGERTARTACIGTSEARITSCCSCVSGPYCDCTILPACGWHYSTMLAVSQNRLPSTIVRAE